MELPEESDRQEGPVVLRKVRARSHRELLIDRVRAVPWCGGSKCQRAVNLRVDEGSGAWSSLALMGQRRRGSPLRTQRKSSGRSMSP